MPKENTHIAFADNLRRNLKREKIKTILDENLEEYYLGAIAPDIFFYHRDEIKTEISSALHGCSGEKTNAVIIAMLEDNPLPRDFAFAAGYMSHTVLDMTFHPVVYYLAGNYYDSDPEKQEMARYRHRYLETALDMILASPLQSCKVISPETIRNMKYSEFLVENFHTTNEEITVTLKRQLFLNRLMTRRTIYPLISPFAGERANRSLFYGHIAKKDRRQSLNDKISVRDIFNGEQRSISYRSLFSAAIEKGLPRLEAMYRFLTGEISRSQLEEAIPGESLDTGSTSKSIRDMKYSIQEESYDLDS